MPALTKCFFNSALPNSAPSIPHTKAATINTGAVQGCMIFPSVLIYLFCAKALASGEIALPVDIQRQIVTKQKNAEGSIAENAFLSTGVAAAFCDQVSQKAEHYAKEIGQNPIPVTHR